MGTIYVYYSDDGSKTDIGVLKKAERDTQRTFTQSCRNIRSLQHLAERFTQSCSITQRSSSQNCNHSSRNNARLQSLHRITAAQVTLTATSQHALPCFYSVPHVMQIVQVIFPGSETLLCPIPPFVAWLRRPCLGVLISRRQLPSFATMTVIFSSSELCRQQDILTRSAKTASIQATSEVH